MVAPVPAATTTWELSTMQRRGGAVEVVDGLGEERLALEAGEARIVLEEDHARVAQHHARRSAPGCECPPILA